MLADSQALTGTRMLFLVLGVHRGDFQQDSLIYRHLIQEIFKRALQRHLSKNFPKKIKESGGPIFSKLNRDDFTSVPDKVCKITYLLS